MSESGPLCEVWPCTGGAELTPCGRVKGPSIFTGFHPVLRKKSAFLADRRRENGDLLIKKIYIYIDVFGARLPEEMKIFCVR